MLTCNIEGSFNFRFTTLYCSITMEYDRNGYLNVTEMQAGMDHRSVRPVSARFLGKFQDAHWQALYGMCIDHDNDQAEMYRDARRDNRGRTYFYESAPGIPDTIAERDELFERSVKI